MKPLTPVEVPQVQNPSHSHLNFQDLSGFLKVNKSKIVHKPLFIRSRKPSPLAQRRVLENRKISEPKHRRLVMRKQKQETLRKHLSPVLLRSYGIGPEEENHS